MRSFEEGLCPFSPSDEAVDTAQHLTDIDEELGQVRLRLDRCAGRPFSCLTVFLTARLHWHEFVVGARHLLVVWR